jgi:hypothetical protein
MPAPLAICLEDLAPAPGSPRYLRCVAVVGRQPGLRVDSAGAVLWQGDADVACELWVSGDDRLILFRPEHGSAVTVRREGRHLAVPVGKPVVLVDQDVFEVGSRRLRVHVHGPASHTVPPSPLKEQRRGRLVRAAAAALALGAAVGGCRGKLEVRPHPPAVSPVPTVPLDAGPGTAPPPPPDAGQAGAARQALDAAPRKSKARVSPATKQPPKIEVRSRPPDILGPNEK